MRIGVVSNPSWKAACKALRLPHVELPPPTLSTPESSAADLSDRLRAGRETLAALADEPVDMILDTSGAGLTLVEGPGGLADLKLTHEVLKVPLVSHFVDPVATAFRGLPWPVVWQALASKWWVKAVWDPRHAEELTGFGIPNVTYLPPAAPEFPYYTSPIDNRECVFDVSFYGDACGIRASGSTDATADPPEQRVTPFYEIYHSGDDSPTPPASSDSPADRIRKSADYFRAKNRFTIDLARQRRDRLVVFLARRLGKRFRVVGRGWDAHGLHPDASFTSAADYFHHFREAAINVTFIEGDTESALNLRHFEITAAGGFLLCSHHPEVAESFEIGRECDTFADEDDLLEKIRYYLDDPKRRREIALAGQQRTLSEHLHRHRLERILSDYAQTRGTAEPRVTEPRVKARADPEGQSSHTIAHGPTSPANDLRVRPDSNAEEKCTPAAPQQVHRGNDTVEGDSGGARGELSPCHSCVTDDRSGLLVLLNPGMVTRHCLQEMAVAASQLGIPTTVMELAPIWELIERGKRPCEKELAAMLREKRIRAVLSYTLQGMAEWPVAVAGDGRLVSVFEQMGIAHLMWWTDHPHWANEKEGLRADLQALLRSQNNHHFVKSEAAARELHEMLGWAHCHSLPVAESPELLKPVDDVEPEFDVVAVLGSVPRFDEALSQFLEQDDPDTQAILQLMARRVDERLASLWTQHAPDSLCPKLKALGKQWVRARSAEPLTASLRVFKRLEPDHREAAEWLRDNGRVYFDAIEVLWDLYRWQRTFILAYLARYFNVAVLGADWSSLGLGRGKWVDYVDQPRAYARGRIAINVSQANDEEGIAHKPFQIAASGVPMLHIERIGLSDCFAPGVEVATFHTPREARDAVAELLADPDRRSTMANAARNRLCREHTWKHRLSQMFAAAGVKFPSLAPRTSQPGSMTRDPYLSLAVFK